MWSQAVYSGLLLAALYAGQQIVVDAGKPIRATDESGTTKNRFGSSDVVFLEFRNPGPASVLCTVAVQPELMPNEGFVLERWTGNKWEPALRPFGARNQKMSVKAGETVVRRWPARWGDPGRYRVRLACEQAAFGPVEFEVTSAKAVSPGPEPGRPVDPPPVATPAPGVFAVTEVVLRPTEPRASGPCPVTITFNGYIAANAAGTVTYTLIRNDGATGPTMTMEFKDAGRQPVTTTWTLGGAVLPKYEGWQAIKILTPQPVESSHEAGAFSMSCSG